MTATAMGRRGGWRQQCRRRRRRARCGSRLRGGGVRPDGGWGLGLFEDGASIDHFRFIYKVSNSEAEFCNRPASHRNRIFINLRPHCGCKIIFFKFRFLSTMFATAMRSQYSVTKLRLQIYYYFSNVLATASTEESRLQSFGCKIRCITVANIKRLQIQSQI